MRRRKGGYSEQQPPQPAVDAAQLHEDQLLADIKAFMDEVDTRVKVFKLDPDLPEIIELKAQARVIVSGPLTHVYLGFLNPYEWCSYGGGRLVIHERWFGQVLMPWTLAEFHHRKSLLDRAITRIRIDKQGTHLYDRGGYEYVRYEGGVLNPDRLCDPGNRVTNAALMVNHFTGLALTKEELRPLYWAEFILDDDGQWQMTPGLQPSVTV